MSCIQLCKKPGYLSAGLVQGASASVYALLACNAVVDPYRRFVWLFGLQLNSLGYAPANPQQTPSIGQMQGGVALGWDSRPWP